MFELLTNDREFAEHNKSIMNGWVADWVPRCISASRVLQPLWSQSDAKPHRFEDGLDRVKSRFAGILSDLDLPTPKELLQ
jgi:propane monooxygenase small subunit